MTNVLRGTVGFLVACCVTLCLVVALPARAGAQQAPAEAVSGKVFNERLVNGETTRDPLPGVTVTVAKASGEQVGQAITDAEGSYTIPLPGPGDYTLHVDPASLPKGVEATGGNGDRAISVRPDQTLVGNFFLGKDTRQVEGKFARLPQSIFDGLFFGLIIAICSVGLSLIYGTTGLSNFAHGEMVTFGAIMAWFADVTWKLPFFVAVVVGLAASVAAGWVFDAGVWAKLRQRRIGLTSQMIVSIGLALFFRQVWVKFFGGRAESYSSFQNQTKPIDLGIIEFPPRVAASLVVCLVVLVGVALFLMRTRFGKAVRAVSDNPDLASATGINTGRVIRVVWLLGGGLAGLGGVLLGLDQKVKWDSGANLLLLMFAAITLGGLGSAFGALVGSLVIGLSVEMSAWLFPDLVDLKRVGALIVLIVMLLVRPQGLLGQKGRVG